jgi:hypothetical protein
MMTFSKQLDLINEADLQVLVDNQVPEDKLTEYKQELPGGGESQRKEFLYDVTAFANASGGDLIFGMKEQGSRAAGLVGLRVDDESAEIQRLDNIIRTGVEPRIPGITYRFVPVRSGGSILILRVRRSWALPHVVKLSGTFRFYSRNANGKYPLDVGELRALFALSETTSERVRTFRRERLGSVVAGETPAALEEGAKLVLHLVPLGAFDPSVGYDLSGLAGEAGMLEPLGAHGWNGPRYNFDGLLTYSDRQGASSSYLQLFRTGVIETVNTSLLCEEKTIPGVAYEQSLMSAVKKYFSIEKQLGVEPPLFIMLSLLGVKGYRIRSEAYWDGERPIDRDAIIIPEVLVESLEAKPSSVLRPIFDAVWNAAGWPGSANYEREGKWREARRR